MNDDEKKPPNTGNASLLVALGLVGQVGVTIAVPPVVGALVGGFIDGKLHDAAPIATLIGLLLGLAAGVYGVFRMISSL